MGDFVSNPTPRPLPADFAEVAKGMSINQIKAHYKAGARAVMRWRDEANHQPINQGKRGGRFRPVPDDFELMAKSLSRYGLEEHYGTGYQVISRWMKETGIMPHKPNPKADKFFAERMHASIAPTRSGSRHELAADTVRKYAPVYRCNQNGSYNPSGSWWRVGWNVLTPDELIDRAAMYQGKEAASRAKAEGVGGMVAA